MGKIYGAYPDIKECAEQYCGYRYRAVITENKNSSEPDLIPDEADFPPWAKNPSSEDIIEYESIYGEFEACKVKDQLVRSQYSLYLTFDKPLTAGGVDEPYNNVTYCTPYQTLKRAFMVWDSKKNDYNISVHHAEAVHDGNWTVPVDNSLKYYFGAKKVCQKFTSNAKYGLFLVAEDRPMLMELCSTPRGYLESISHFFHESINWSRKIEEERENHLIKDTIAPIVAEGIAGEVKLKIKNNDQKSALADIVGFGLENGMAKVELYSIALGISANTCEVDQFLYKFRTIVSLRVAQKLNKDNVIKYGVGISEDFDSFIDSVRSAIEDGRINFKTSGMKYFGHPGIFISYDYKSNEMTMPVIDRQDSTMTMFNLVIRTCYDAYLDMKSRPLERGDAESQTIGISYKADLLLHRAFGIYEDYMIHHEGRKWVEDALDRAQEIFISKCMGFPVQYIEDTTKTLSTGSQWFIRWLNELDLELRCKGRRHASDLIREWDRDRTFRHIENNKAEYNKISVGVAFDRGHMDNEIKGFQKDISSQISQIIGKVTDSLYAFVNAPLDSKERYTKALEYMHYHFYYLSKLHYYYLAADKESIKEEVRKLSEVLTGMYLGNINLLSDALNNQRYEYNGI